MSIVAQYGRFTNAEEEAGEIYDLSGNNNTGTLNDSAAFLMLGARGRVLNFTGTNADATIPDSASLSPTTALSVGAWIYKTDMDRAMFVDKDNSYRLWTPLDDNRPAFNFYAGGAWREFTSTNLVIPTNQWIFLQAGYDSATNTVRMYCQGSLNREETTWNHGIVNDGLDQVYLGDYAYGGYQFAGMMGEVIIRDTLVDAATHKTDLKRWLKKRSMEVHEFLEIHIPSISPIYITTSCESIDATVWDVLGISP